jgi:large subunit ribosomal protein L31
MKSEIHPESYRKVVFQDSTVGKSWVCSSTVQTDKTITWEDGVEYPLYGLTISSYSHPFYTGSQRLVDTEGRVDKFKKKYERRK